MPYLTGTAGSSSSSSRSTGGWACQGSVCSTARCRALWQVVQCRGPQPQAEAGNHMCRLKACRMLLPGCNSPGLRELPLSPLHSLRDDFVASCVGVWCGVGQCVGDKATLSGHTRRTPNSCVEGPTWGREKGEGGVKGRGVRGCEGGRGREGRRAPASDSLGQAVLCHVVALAKKRLKALIYDTATFHINSSRVR